MEKKPVGRGRGRARGVPVPQQPTTAQAAWARDQAPSSMAPREFGPAIPPSSIGRSVRAPGPAVYTGGDGDHRPSLPPADAPTSGGGGGGDSSASLGRGAMRGRRVIYAEILNTLPQHVNSKKGTSGTSIPLSANYFKIVTKPDWCLYQYDVSFDHEEDRTGVRKGLLSVHKEKLGAYMFDGTTMYTSNRLTAVGQNMVLYSQRQSDQAKIGITLKLVRDVVKGDSQYLQFYNILTRKCLECLRLQLIGRNYFDPNAKIEIREYQFEVWPGYLTSIRQHEVDILMCAEINHKVLRQETLLNILERVRDERSRDYQNAYKAEVIGSICLTNYNNKTYRIDDVDFSANPMSTFHYNKERKDITYKDYYSSRYGITIRNSTQPLLVSRLPARALRADQSEIVYLIPELCRATGLTDKMRKDFRLMTAVAQHTRVTPDKRIEKLLSFNNRLNNEAAVQKEFHDWNLTLDSQLVRVQGRTLPREKIVWGNNKVSDGGIQADWTNSIKDNSLYMTTPLKQWVLIIPSKIEDDVKRFVAAMCRSTKNFSISEPHVKKLSTDRLDFYINALEEVLSKQTPQLVMCILMRDRADIYSAIKKKCCIDRPVPSQVVTARCFNPKRTLSIATKVAIQLNCKIGGFPWTVPIPLSGLMVIGYDVCHDTNDRKTDFGAMVASLDKQMGRYYSAVSAHTSGEELSNHLATNVAKALRKYQEVNRQALPTHIMFYRDGVGEGQIPFVVDHEVKQVRDTISKFYPNPDEIKLGYVLVTKRINTRFFQGKSNPPPGTVVDDIITNPVRYDFFLISQSVEQGTVSPTSYNVIDDTTGLSPDRIQILTYKLTHLYFNCSKTMRVPAPVQFAHKLAFLVSQSIHSAPTDRNLESLLYFL